MKNRFFAMLATVAASACGGTGLTGPDASPSAALTITAFSVAASVEGSTYRYTPTLTLRVPGDEGVTVTALWVELEDRYNGKGSYVPGPAVQYRIPAGASRQLFEHPPSSLETDFDADRSWVVVSYVDDRGRAGEVQATTTVNAGGPRGRAARTTGSDSRRRRRMCR